MEDGPEALLGCFTYGEHDYDLVEREPGVWIVADGSTHLGTVEVVVPRTDGQYPTYAAHLPDAGATSRQDVTTDWPLAVEYVIDRGQLWAGSIHRYRELTERRNVER